MKTKKVPFDINKAKAGAKVVTKSGLNVTIREFIDDELYHFPIEAFVKDPTGKTTGKDTLYYTKEGRFLSSCECDLDLLIVEEEKTDNYDPYKATVESIADMVERYSELQSIEELKDFYNNVRVKCQDAFDYGRVCMINLDEEPDDNDTPKFKVGDFIVNDYCMGKVIELTDDAYLLDTGQGIPFSCEHNAHLWSIENAKAGDVLVNGTNIFIFYFINDTRIMGYCHVNIDDDRFYNDLGKNECFGLIDAIFTPATKEQCDLLFQKMKETGYEWNSDKKELHKIEEVKNVE